MSGDFLSYVAQIGVFLSGDFMSYVAQIGDFLSGDFVSGDFLTWIRSQHLIRDIMQPHRSIYREIHILTHFLSEGSQCKFVGIPSSNTIISK